MKIIKPILIWDNGTNQSAEILNAYCINDNLSTSATFYYALLSAEQSQLAQGNLSMSGEFYDAWETNDYAYNWIAGQLNLEIVGDWVEPVIEPKEEAIVEEPLVEEPLNEESLSEGQTDSNSVSE